MNIYIKKEIFITFFSNFYYPKKYNLNKQIEELVTRYDLLIIPETEVEGQTIYD